MIEISVPNLLHHQELVDRILPDRGNTDAEFLKIGMQALINETKDFMLQVQKVNKMPIDNDIKSKEPPLSKYIDAHINPAYVDALERKINHVESVIKTLGRMLRDAATEESKQYYFSAAIKDIRRNL